VKKCRTCDEVLPLSAYSRDVRTPEGVKFECKPCASLRVSLRRRGMTHAEYDAMCEAQDGRCFICRKPPSRARLCIDHDHATGAVRGLLCSRCNSALGLLDDDVDALERALTYLKFSRLSEAGLRELARLLDGRPV
jgi:hypothetical protein